MTPGSPLRVGALLFDGFELLDFYGPLEMYGLLGKEAVITVLAEKVGAVRSSAGPSGHADAAMEESGGFDVLLVPGGIGTRKLRKKESFVRALKRVAEASELVTTVCTGSYLLASTGLLDGRRATSNKRVFQEVVSGAPKVNWVAKARWVEDGKYITSSGISAGMDMTLAVIAKLLGRETGVEVAKRAEYHWQEDSTDDPFAEE
jgi:transcriptional regulator GlxA family with amidase domain